MTNDPKYLKYFIKFHEDRIESMNGSEEYRCKGCKNEIEFRIEENSLLYSCSGEGKCGEQFRIDLPIYINYFEEKERLIDLFKETKETKHEKELDKLEKLYEKINNKEENEELYESIMKIRDEHNKKKLNLMKEINNEQEDEIKKDLYKKYALLWKIEKDTLLPMIQRIREPSQYLLMIQEPKVTVYNNTYENLEKHEKEEPIPDEPELEPKPEPDKPEPDKPEPEPKEKKYTYDEQIEIMIRFYGKYDKKKTEEDVIGIVNRRRNKGDPIGTRIPTVGWKELCKKLEKKYGENPLEMSIDTDEVKSIDELKELTDITKFSKKRDIYDPKEKKECEKMERKLTWEKLKKFKNPKDYTKYLLELNTNPLPKDKNNQPKYITFNQIYFNAADEYQFERYGYLQSRILSYPEKQNKNSYSETIFNENNKITTYQTFGYLFDKLKKGVYIAIKDNELLAYVPFTNANYINNWSGIIEKSNKKLVKKMLNEKRGRSKEFKNIQDLSHWYANNCIFSGEKMRFEYGERPLYFIAEGDKTLVPFKYFLEGYLEEKKKKKETIEDIEFYFNPRDFPVLRKGYKEPYDQIFGDKKIEEEYQYDTYTPILSQCTHNDYHDIAIPTEDDMKRISDKIYHESCDNKYLKEEKYISPDEFKKKETKCVFRGSATGCGITPETNMRLKACLLSYEWNKKGDNILDAKLTGWNRKPKMTDGKLDEIKKINFPKDLVVGEENFMNGEEQSKCKYILNIDGHVKAFRLGNEMRMGSVILLVESEYKLWFQKYMEPMEHYIPIKPDLSNLKEQLEWCKENDDKCGEIAKRSLEFYNQYLTKEKTYEIFDEMIQNLSQIRKEPIMKKNENHMKIIVAYRDSGDNYRSKQLSVFIDQMKAIFEKITNLEIIIVEQESEREDYDDLPKMIQQEKTKMAKFNLGRLKNIGFHLGNQKKEKNQYYILTDVDLLPSEDLISEYLTVPKDEIIHLGNKGTRWENNNKDTTFLGGVISFSEKEFIESNGYPNNFWGWGGEDDALLYRMKEKNIQIKKPNDPVIDLEEYSIREKNIDLKEQGAKEERKWEKVKNDKKVWKENGLSSLEKTYSIKKEINYKDMKNVKHYFVTLNIMDEDKIKY